MNRNMNLKTFILKVFYTSVLLLLLSIKSIAQNDSGTVLTINDKPKNIFSINLGAHYGFIFVHSKKAESTRGSNPYGLEFNLAWQRNDTSAVNICNCYPRKGVLFSYYNYDNHALGKMLGVAYFLEPSYRLNKNLFFSFRGTVGGSYLTNPADSINNPENRSYSTAFNFYLTLGMGLWFRLNDHWWLNSTVNFQHISNGGMKLPNLGINWPTAGLTVSYQKNPMPYNKVNRHKEKDWKNYSVRWDTYLFGMVHKVMVEDDRMFPLFGAGIQAGKQVSRINALTLSAEIFSDEAKSQELKQKYAIDASPVRAGIMFGNEFILGRFLFSQRIGAYVYNETTFPSLFHRWGLLYRTSSHWSFGFSFLAHGKTADFFDAKLAYSWQKRRGKL